MFRNEHNEHWGINRQPDEVVSCHCVGRGELDQYDARCAACWLGHPHTWAEHDENIQHYLRNKTETEKKRLR